MLYLTDLYSMKLVEHSLIFSVKNLSLISLVSVMAQEKDDYLMKCARIMVHLSGCYDI